MARKKGYGRVGRWGDSFDGKGKLPKPESVKTIKPSMQWNDPMPQAKFDDFTNPVCTSDTDLKIDMNNQIFGGPGRTQGEVVLYESSQFFNYKVAWSRFEKAKALVPSYVHKISNNKYKVGYCTSGSPDRFWEVDVSLGNGTYINLSNPNLTILCPRPFSVTEFSQINTDATELVWEQLQGRIAIISPLSGDGSLNPTISIIGNRTSLDPPILIKVSLPDDPDIFDILAIDTTLTERLYNISCNNLLLKYDPQYQVQLSTLTPYRPYPTGTPANYPVDLSTTTWSIPAPLSADYLTTIWEKNTTGIWVQFDITPVDQARIVSLDLLTHYRIVSIYGKHNTEDWRVISPVIYLLNYGNKGVVVDESPFENISCFNNLKSTFQTDPFAVKIRNEAENYYNISCYNNLKSTFQTDPFAVKIRNETENYYNISCYNNLKSTFQTDPLGGIIIG